MRIGVDARLTYHQPAGISRYTRHLLQAMAKLDIEDTFYIFQHRKHAVPVVEQSNFRRATIFAPVHTRLEQYMLPVELLRLRLDLLHCTDFIPPLHSNVPVIITVHDLAFLHWPHFLTRKSAAYYGQIDRAVKHAQHIIVPSEHTKQDLTARLGTPPQKITVIYEAADHIFVPLPVESARAELAKKYNLPERFVLFVSTIEPRKNVNGLLHAFRHLLDKYGTQDVGLVLAGGHGWLFEETVELLKSLKLEPHVQFLGRVSDQDLHRLYVAARCHVHPAHYEGFGLPPLEAMACGTPTIVSNVSSLPEVVGDAALLIDPQNWEEIAVALHRLLTDDTLHAELREKGFKRAGCFNWELAARKTLEVYHHVAASTSATSFASHPPASTRQVDRQINRP
jgi:glycosyltransferase involved in cell wall biosynthesis